MSAIVYNLFGDTTSDMDKLLILIVFVVVFDGVMSLVNGLIGANR